MYSWSLFFADAPLDQHPSRTHELHAVDALCLPWRGVAAVPLCAAWGLGIRVMLELSSELELRLSGCLRGLRMRDALVFAGDARAHARGWGDGGVGSGMRGVEAWLIE